MVGHFARFRAALGYGIWGKEAAAPCLVFTCMYGVWGFRVSCLGLRA